MADSTSRGPLEAEIARIITLAARSGSVVRTSHYAETLAKTYGRAGISMDEIIEALARAASEQGLPVEISRPEAERTALG